ncbi:MAG: hypothetical protein ACRBHB_16625 [Arenicella sp.]
MLSLTLTIVVILSVVCVLRPNFLLICCVLIGFAQDPLRKLIAGEPVFMVVMVGVVFGAGMLGYFLRDGLRSLSEIQVWTPSFKIPILLFFFLVFYQTIYSFIAYENIILTGIGVAAYIAPLFAISISYFAIRNNKEFQHFLLLYCLFSCALAVTVYLSFSGIEHKIFKEVGAGLVIYDQGTILKAHSGFMRTSEVAGWHLGAGASFLLILAFASRNKSTMLLSTIAIVVLIVAIGLTGRRKMIMQFFIFACLYSILFMYFRRNISAQVLLAVVIVIGIIWGVSFFVFPSLAQSNIDLYYARGISVFADADERFKTLGLQSISWAINRVGWFGGGVGIASQGTQSLGVSIAGGAGEGGLGKIVAELGVPGLLVSLWLVYTTVRFFYKTLNFVSRTDTPTSRVAIGITAFALSNVPTYIVASQVYGDLFILILLGFLVGFVFALPKVMFIEAERQQLEQKQNLDL